MNQAIAPPATAKERASPEKMALILNAARQLFMERGFSAASMEAIAKASGVGKATLYANFARKEDIFGAMVVGESVGRAAILPGETRDVASLRLNLAHFAHSFVELLLSPTNVAMYRIISAEAARFPDLGRIFYENGPARILARLAEYLAQAIAAGHLQSGPPALMAAQFIGIVRADMQMRAMLGVDGVVDNSVWHATVESGVDAFIRAYGCVAKTAK